MAGIAKGLNLLFIIATAVAYAGCGGPQQIGQSASLQPQANPAETPWPRGIVSHAASKPLPRTATGKPLLYVGDDYGPDVAIFPLTGPNKKQIGSISKDMDGPWGLSLDANNALYVANRASSTVTVYPYGSTSASMTYSHGVVEPLYALSDSAGHVYVSGRKPARHNRGLIFEYNIGTNTPIAHVILGSEADGMTEDAQGNLYVAYRLTGPNCHIAEFGPNLTNKRHLTMTINQPQGLLLDNAGNLVVVESENQDIKVFPPGASTPSLTLNLYDLGTGNLAQLAMQNSETKLWVSTEGGYVYSMPYPLTPSTVPTEYENIHSSGNGIVVSAQ